MWPIRPGAVDVISAAVVLLLSTATSVNPLHLFIHFFIANKCQNAFAVTYN